jgi:hypothetical protein
MKDPYLLEEKLARKTEKFQNLKSFKKILTNQAEKNDRDEAEKLLNQPS